MEIKETLNKGLKRAYSMTIKHTELETKVEAKLREAQPNVELRGFRKGKVPFALLKKQFGQNIMGEVMQESVDGAMREHMEKSGDRPAAQPEMKMTNENWKEGEDVQIALSYECMPDIPKADFSKVKLERLTVKPEAEDINGALDNLAGSAQDFADKTGAAADGDQVVMDFIGSIDGVAFDGGTGTDYPLVLGSNSFIPGFEAQLIGVKSGDSKTVNVDFPTEYASAELAGKAASFACTIKAVKKPVAAKIDDEFAKKFGAENLADLKGKISDRLKEEYAGAARMVMKRELMDELDKLVDFDLPEGLLESEANQIAHSMWHEENPEVQGHDHPEIKPTAEHTKLAKRRVRLGLLLAEVGELQKITVTDAEMQQALMQEAQKYPGQEKEFFEFVSKNPQMQQQMRAPIFEDKVVDYIVELADVNEKTVSKDVLKTAVEALG